MEKERRPVNLQERPSPARREVARGKRALARFKQLSDINVSSNEQRLAAVKTHNGDITAIAYRGEHFIYDSLNVFREMHDLIPEMQTLCEAGALPGKHPPHSKENDLWETKFRGLSLLDIENMELDPQTQELAPEDIRKINRMFRARIFSRFNKDKSAPFVVESLTYFASQQWTHPEIGVPRSLEKFHDNTTAYFDYYTSFLTDFKRDPINEDSMLIMLMWGRPDLPGAVGAYLPARLNITPSSAIKLFKQRELLAPDVPSRFAWRRFEKIFLPRFKQAYKDNAFPEDLAQYQHYSEEIDSAAAGRMLSYIQETSTAKQQVKNKDEAGNLLEQWNKHKRDVTREIMQHPKKRLEYQVSQEHPAEKITMIRNRDTFVFIMRFPDNIHLTLEIDKTGKLFGVPPSLVKAYPHVSDAFIVDILKPLLEKYKAKDAPNTIEQNTIWQISGKPEISEELTQEDEQKEEEQTTKPPKRKRLVPGVTIFESDPLPPLTPQAPKVERFVAYSEDKVKELLGPRVSRQQVVVDQVLRSINNFERGHAHSKMLTDSGPIIRIRTGDYRILMDRLGGGNYSIREIVHRKDAPY